MHNTFGRAFLYIMAAYALSAIVLYSTGAFGAGYDSGFKETPLSELGPKYHFLDNLHSDGVTYLWVLESNEDRSHTLSFLPKRNLTKREMQNTHEAVCRMAKHFPGFTLEGTAFYLPNGILYGSPCIRADGKGAE